MSEYTSPRGPDKSRQDRVQLLKRVIIVTLITAILVPTLLCIYLLIKLNGLENKMDELSGKMETENTEKAHVPETAKQDSILSITESGNATQDEKEAAEVDTKWPEKVYLTFDDGPSVLTQDILDILEQYQVKATFFVVGKQEKDLLPMYAKIVDGGHVIGMHSYSHKYNQIYASVDAFGRDLDQIRELIYTQTGVWSSIYRFPGGSSNDVSSLDMTEYIKYLNGKGIEYYDWNVAAGDATENSISACDILDNTFSGIGKHREAIVLMHDTGNKKTTVDALPAMIKGLQDRGIKLAVIDQNTELIQHVKNDD